MTAILTQLSERAITKNKNQNAKQSGLNLQK